jgi:hypothetical protein
MPMANLFDYLYWRGGLSVEREPLNPVDALILSWSASMPLKNPLPDTLGEAARYDRETPPRGKFVLVIHGANPPEEAPLTVEQAADLARDLMEEEGLSSSMAAKRVAAETGLKKGDIYRLLTEEN